MVCPTLSVVQGMPGTSASPDSRAITFAPAPSVFAGRRGSIEPTVCAARMRPVHIGRC